MSSFSDLVDDSLDPQILSEFADDDFTYIQKAGGSYALTGVLTSGTELQKAEGVYYTIWAPVANFTLGEPLNGDKVVIGGNLFRVAGTPERDDLGLSRTIKLSGTN